MRKKYLWQLIIPPCINYHDKWQFCSHTVVWLRRKEKNNSVSLSEDLEQESWPSVQNRIQVEIRKGENYSTCVWWLNRKKKLMTFILFWLRRLPEIWFEMSFLFRTPLVEDPGIYQYLTTTKNIAQYNLTQMLLPAPQSQPHVFLTSIDLSRIYSSWTQVCIQILLLL